MKYKNKKGVIPKMQEQKEEKLIDLKGTLKQLVEADEPELSQEEAIMKFGYY